VFDLPEIVEETRGGVGLIDEEDVAFLISGILNLGENIALISCCCVYHLLLCALLRGKAAHTEVGWTGFFGYNCHDEYVKRSRL